MMFKRLLNEKALTLDSTFLFGARQTGKTTLLLDLFPNALFYDLLENNTFERLQRNPSLLRQDLEMCDSSTLVIIDEVQSLLKLLFFFKTAADCPLGQTSEIQRSPR